MNKPTLGYYNDVFMAVNDRFLPFWSIWEIKLENYFNFVSGFDLYRQRGFLGIDSSNFFENSSYLSRDMVISVMT